MASLGDQLRVLAVDYEKTTGILGDACANELFNVKSPVNAFIDNACRDLAKCSSHNTAIFQVFAATHNTVRVNALSTKSTYEHQVSFDVSNFFKMWNTSGLFRQQIFKKMEFADVTIIPSEQYVDVIKFFIEW